MEADLGARLERNLGTGMEKDLEASLDIRVVPQRGSPSSSRLGPERFADSEHASCALQSANCRAEQASTAAAGATTSDER